MELMNHIIESGFINKIRFIQIQFHNFVDNAKPLRNEIRKKLKKHICAVLIILLFGSVGIKLHK